MVSIRWGKQREREYISGIMEKYMMESGTMVLNMAMAYGKASMATLT